MIRRKWYLFASIIIGSLLVGFIIIGPIPDPLFADNYSTIVLDEHGQLLRVFLNADQQWLMPDDGRAIPDKLKTAVIHYEDKRFTKHLGIDPIALGRAIYQNVLSGERISGASTITMQVARLMQPKARTVTNKLVEMVQAVKIELTYSKDEILKYYLLNAPYGSNIIGYRAASLRYFGKEPESLSWAEAATIAVLPNNPANVSPITNPSALKAKRDRLLLSLHTVGHIDQTTYKLAVAEPVADRQYPFTLSAPHLAERLARNIEQSIIYTTINKQVQDQTAKLLKEYIDVVGRQGVRNGAVLITDTNTGQVKAYAASQDYFDNDNYGKIDGIQMKRSAGSTLKPFLYGLAMDQGLIIPQSIIPDIPISYGGYTPYNVDRSFRGVVRADDALIRSLNAPTVYLLNLFRVDNFYQFLQTAGIGGLSHNPEEYGLSIVLGGCEVSLWELSKLYRGLANYGEFSDIYVLADHDQKSENPQQLVSVGSAYSVLEVLKELERPGLESYWRRYQSSLPVAWKTGTSYGDRDAWAVGVSPKWTVAVWVGSFSGREIKGLTGIDSAAPLLFQLFNQLEKDPHQIWFTKPEGELIEINVSPETGYRLKNEYEQMDTALISATANPLRYSPYEQILYLNSDETMQVCSRCWDREDLKAVQKVVYPPNINNYLRSIGREYNLPPHNPNCPALQQTNPISFIYPQQDSHIFIPRDVDGEYQQITLEIAHAYEDIGVFWYLDDQYLGETNDVHTLSLSLDTGWHRLYVIDGEGNSSVITFYSERR